MALKLQVELSREAEDNATSRVLRREPPTGAGIASRGIPNPATGAAIFSLKPLPILQSLFGSISISATSVRKIIGPRFLAFSPIVQKRGLSWSYLLYGIFSPFSVLSVSGGPV